MEQLPRSRSKKRNTRTVKKRFCCWCKKEVLDSQAWIGDISGAIALSLADGTFSRSTPRNALALCLSCGTDKLRQFLENLNDATPELRLRSPVPRMFETRDHPIPNLAVCYSFFYKCGSAISAKHLADLLLEFERAYPVEWGYSGWTNDSIAELVLGRTDYRGGSISVRESRRTAQYWFSNHWKSIPRTDETPERTRALWAARELNALHPKKAVPSGNSTPRLQGETLYNAFVSTLEKLYLSDSKSSEYLSPATYQKYELFIRWLDKLVADPQYQIRSSFGSGAFIANVVKQFRTQRPYCGLKKEVLVYLARAFCICYKQAVRRQENVMRHGQENRKGGRLRMEDACHAIDPSKVVLHLVAHQHGVSPRLVAKVRAEINKQNART